MFFFFYIFCTFFLKNIKSAYYNKDFSSFNNNLENSNNLEIYNLKQNILNYQERLKNRKIERDRIYRNSLNHFTEFPSYNNRKAFKFMREVNQFNSGEDNIPNRFKNHYDLNDSLKKPERYDNFGKIK